MVSCTCNIVGMLNMNYDGIISASIGGTSNFIYVLQACIEGVVDKVLKGPSTGNITLTAYGYPAGTADKYLGVGCPSKAGVNIPLISKFDCENNFTRFFPRRGGTAFTAGDPIDGITLIDEVCSFEVLDASAQGGPYNPYFLTEQQQGAALIWTGGPIPIDTTTTGNLFYNLQIGNFNIQAYLSNFSIEVNPPSGARVSYSFQYDIPDCEVGPGVVISASDLTDFEFMACDSINITYAPTGLAQVSFTVYSDSDTPSRNFNSLTFGGVVFDGYVASLVITPIPGTAVFEHRYQMHSVGN